MHLKSPQELQELNQILQVSVIEGDLDTVRKMIEQGADVRCNNHLALRNSANSGQLEILQYLLSHGGDATKVDGDTFSNVILNKNSTIFFELIRCGGNIRPRIDSHAYWSVRVGVNDIAIYLIEQGANLNAVLDVAKDVKNNEFLKWARGYQARQECEQILQSHAQDDGLTWSKRRI